MWRLCWLQLLCHHCISSVQGLDYTKFLLRTLPCVKFLYLLSATLYTTTYDPPLLSLSLPPPFLPPLQLCLPPPVFSSTLHPSPCCSTPFTLLCSILFLSVLLSSFCLASFLSSLLPVDSEIPVLRKFWPWFMVGQEILVCRQTDSLN